MIKSIINTLSEIKIYINLGIGIAIFLVLTIFRNQIAKFILNIIAKVFLNKKPNQRETFKRSLQHPISIFFVVLGIFSGIYLNYRNEFVLDIFKISTILIFSWALVCYVSDNIGVLFNLKSANTKINGVAVKFIANILKTIIVCIAIVMVVSELGYNINGLITGLGVSGLAVSLATQDTLKNLVSGFVLIFDKPFDVGDFIETTDFKGTVEDITMRSTRVRKLDDSIIIVPNSTLSDSLITNYAKLTRKLVEFKIGLTYSTTHEALKNCEQEIYDYLDKHEMVDSKTIRVRFTEYDSSSINILIRCYIDTTDIEKYHKFLEELNFEIKRIIDKNDTDFAFPTTSVIIEKD